MTIGMPSIDITFKKLAASLIERSERGIVALIIKDDTDNTYAVKEYKSALVIESDKFTSTNADYIKDVFTGGAAKVIVVPIETASTDVVADAIAALGSRKVNWIGLAEGTATEQDDLVLYIKEQESLNKTMKAVVFDTTAPDSQHVVNFTNESVTYEDGTTVTGDKFVARLLGLLASLPLTRSATYYAFADLVSVVEPADLDTAIENGEFVLFNDEGTVRVARSVNSLQTTSSTVTEDFKKIIVVETLDQIKEDVSNVFKIEYIGRFKNSYDNQVLLISSINGYLSNLSADDILDRNYDNRTDVNVETQRAALIASGKTEAEDWNDQQIKNMTYGSNVYLAGQIKVTDAMEDISFSVELA
ncbi:phage tail sheath C-terminal domain-containing protein [Marinicrinis sediminis]|uniref:Phage tail sheath C-terminal domain-containing protein n=1 Tax=Marinicrinis sediminis TaxID=1652465 RepID=A0ABW5RB52_9BACL